MFNEEISFFIKLFSIVFLGLFSGVDAETFSWQKSWRVSSYVGIIWCVGRFSTTTSKYLLTLHTEVLLWNLQKRKKNPFCSFLSNHWYIHFPQDGYKIKILVKFFKNVDFGILRKSYEFLKWHFFPISKHHARFFMYYYCISIRSLLVNEISQCLIWLHRYLLKKCIK